MARFWYLDIAILAIEFLLIAAAALFTFCLIFGVPKWPSPSGFASDNATAYIKSAIKKEFENRGATPSEIIMFKKDDSNIGGYVKIQLGNLSVVRPCSAHYDKIKDQYSWNCEAIVK